MHLSVKEICAFAQCTPSSRNFMEEENLLCCGHLLTCGITSQDDDKWHLTAYCLQMSDVKGAPHEINIVILKSGKISSAKCSCKAGMSAKCKHTVAVLLYCNRHDVEKFENISCTDKKCIWNVQHSAAVDGYKSAPLEDHKCFNICEKKSTLTDEQIDYVKNRLFTIPSALTKHMCGRHSPVSVTQIPVNPSPEINIIVQNLPSKEMHALSNEKPLVDDLATCCKKKLKSLEKDVLRICESSQASISVWKQERQFRVTGSRCYALYTYFTNKKANPNWKDKSLKYFYPKKIANTYIMHGLANEPLARKRYVEISQWQVVECGLVISDINPWLGYSPDGVVFQDNKPVRLLEIKCPYSGKTNKISDVLNDLKYLKRDKSSKSFSVKLPESSRDDSLNALENSQYTARVKNFILKEKHEYYAQIQFGMAVLNLKKTDFVIYSPFDHEIVVIPVDYDEIYVKDLLKNVKLAYFEHMLHNVCLDDG